MRVRPDDHMFRRWEAERIYAAIFGQPAPSVATGRFLAASERLDRTVDPEELDRYRRAIARCDDLEALEVAARYLHRSDLLNRKFRLMAYLAETAPENQTFFVNEHSSFLAGLWHSAAGTIHTIVKLAKGVWLLRLCDYA